LRDRQERVKQNSYYSLIKQPTALKVQLSKQSAEQEDSKNRMQFVKIEVEFPRDAVNSKFNLDSVIFELLRN